MEKEIRKICEKYGYELNYAHREISFNRIRTRISISQPYTMKELPDVLYDDRGFFIETNYINKFDEETSQKYLIGIHKAFMMIQELCDLDFKELELKE